MKYTEEDLKVGVTFHYTKWKNPYIITKVGKENIVFIMDNQSWDYAKTSVLRLINDNINDYKVTLINNDNIIKLTL